MTEYISDILLGLGALAAACYCIVLSKKLSRFSGLDQELGAAIAVLSRQVDDLTSVLKETQTSAETTKEEIEKITERAEIVASELKSIQNNDRVVSTLPIAVENEPPSNDLPDHDGGLVDHAPSLFLRHSKGGI